MPKHQAVVQLRAAGDGHEIHEASLQFVRKIQGFTHPSKANEAALQQAVDAVAASAIVWMLADHEAPPRDREVEAEKAKVRSVERFRPRLIEELTQFGVRCCERCGCCGHGRQGSG